MRDEVFSRAGNYTYVNSATSMSPDRLEDHLPELQADGSIETAVLYQKLIENDTPYKIGETVIFGHTAIRIRAESAFNKYRGKAYCKRHTNELIKEAGFIQEFFVNSSYALQWAYDSTIDTFAKEHCKK